MNYKLVKMNQENVSSKKFGQLQTNVFTIYYINSSPFDKKLQ